MTADSKSSMIDSVLDQTNFTSTRSNIVLYVREEVSNIPISVEIEKFEKEVYDKALIRLIQNG